MFGLFKPPKPVFKELPWIVEGKKVFGFHELYDKPALSEWLRSDGKFLGDPSKLPWCGDYTETAIKNSLPNEVFTGAVGKNPYWARNWLQFGIELRMPLYGCVLVFGRKGGGHVGFAIGEDASHYYVLGGNQSNAVNITRITKSRLLPGGARWPKSFEGVTKNLPQMKPDNIPVSTNEF